MPRTTQTYPTRLVRTCAGTDRGCPRSLHSTRVMADSRYQAATWSPQNVVLHLPQSSKEGARKGTCRASGQRTHYATSLIPDPDLMWPPVSLVILLADVGG
jgi:hypothetical protein